MLKRSWARCCLIAILSAVLLTPAAGPRPVVADGLDDVVRSLSTAFQRKKPRTVKDRTVEDLADQIDWLEFNLETYGTIVPKHPDVWGEARLTRHRQEFEREMFREFDQFTETLQAAIRRTDQAYFGAALAISNNQQGNQGGPSSSSSSVTGLMGDPNAAGQQIIDRKPTRRIDLNNFNTDNRSQFDTGRLSLEPTVVLDQKARYLNHLNELRRVNEGDDITDSPGYALNLVRIPISVLPGKKTREGYGAELTVTADLHLTDDLLPTTFRNLIIEDVVDQLALPITKVLEDEGLVAELDTYIKKTDNLYKAYERLSWLKSQLGSGRGAPETRMMKNLLEDSIENIYVDNPDLLDQARHEFSVAFENQNYAILLDAINRLIDKLLEGTIEGQDDQTYSFKNAKSTFAKKSETERVRDNFILAFREWQGRQPMRSRRSPLAYPPSQVHDIFGQSFHVLAHVTLDTQKSLANRPKRQIHLMDVQRFLRTELEAAYRLVTDNDCLLLTSHCGPQLVQAIRRRDRKLYDDEEIYNDALTNVKLLSIIDLRDKYFDDIKRHYPRAAHTTTVSLGWAIIVESALLNDRLMKDMREVAQGKGCDCYVGELLWADFYLPKPSPAAIATFNEYVRCRWPIHVFALDPVTQDQNVADTFNRRREMQLAISVAMASGKMNASAAARFARRLETDIETIALNRTAVGFSHGSNTFGWRFYPRVQTPPTPSTLGAFGQTLFGGPSADDDLKRRQLEPAIRECHALVVMPSFVPQVTFDTRANWFELTNPRKKMLTMNDAMMLSRSYQAIQSQLHTVCHSDFYRPGDIAHLQRAVSHLDRRLPLQNMLVEIPYENTSGGFELFSNGITDLAPELIGWYGAPGVIAAKNRRPGGPGAAAVVGYHRDHYPPHHGTTLFLVGNGFSVHDTRVIVGGKSVPHMLLSRQVMEVTIPTTVSTVLKDGVPFVDAHVATPYGISSHMLIPALTTSTQPAALHERLAPMRFHVQPKSKLRFNFAYERDGGSVQGLRLIDADSKKTVKIAYDAQAQLPLADRSGLHVLMAIYHGKTLLAPAQPVLRVDPSQIDVVDAEGAILVRAEFVEFALKALVNVPDTNELTNLYANGHQAELEFQAVFFVEPFQRDDDQAKKSALPVRVDGQLVLQLNQRPESSDAN